MYKFENLDKILVTAFNNRKRPFIEVTGPILEGYGLVDFKKLPRKVWVSNTKHGLLMWEMDQF